MCSCCRAAPLYWFQKIKNNLLSVPVGLYASAIDLFAQIGSGDQDDFSHERPSLFKLQIIQTTGIAFKEHYYTAEFAQMLKEIGPDPTYTNA